MGRYATIRWESSQDVIGNSSITISKGKMTEIKSNIKFDNPDVIEFNSKQEITDYIQSAPRIDTTPRQPDVEEHIREVNIPEKWIDNYLSQNTKTVMSALMEDKPGQKSLKLMMGYERKHKNRKVLLKFMEGLYGGN